MTSEARLSVSTPPDRGHGQTRDAADMTLLDRIQIALFGTYQSLGGFGGYSVYQPPAWAVRADRALSGFFAFMDAWGVLIGGLFLIEFTLLRPIREPAFSGSLPYWVAILAVMGIIIPALLPSPRPRS